MAVVEDVEDDREPIPRQRICLDGCIWLEISVDLRSTLLISRFERISDKSGSDEPLSDGVKSLSTCSN